MKTSLPFFLIILWICACKTQERTFEFKTADFGHYYDRIATNIGSKFSVHPKSFKDGIYVFDICKVKEVFGNEQTDWYGNCDSLKVDEKDVKQYTCLIFLDDYRVQYYTVYDRDPDVKADFDEKNPEENMEKIKEAKATELDSTNGYYYKREFDIAYNKWKYSMRGYYKVEYTRSDSSYWLRMKMEKIVGKKKMKWVEKRRNKLNKKRAKKGKKIKKGGKMFNKENHFVELYFKLDTANNALKMEQFKVDDPFRGSNDPERVMVYETRKEFESPPVYKFIPFPVKFYFCGSPSDSCAYRNYFTDIKYKVNNEKIEKVIYLNGNTLVKEERPDSTLAW